jgi:hypothetical protein
MLEITLSAHAREPGLDILVDLGELLMGAFTSLAGVWTIYAVFFSPRCESCRLGGRRPPP